MDTHRRYSPKKKKTLAKKRRFIAVDKGKWGLKSKKTLSHRDILVFT
jgi:hypothetical protein